MNWGSVWRGLLCLAIAAGGLGASRTVAAQTRGATPGQSPQVNSRTDETTQDLDQKLAELDQLLTLRAENDQDADYRIGPEDLLDISVFEAPEMNREVRVSASGEISLPLLGGVRASGLTPQSLEFVLEELLRRSYMKDPHVSVFVKEMESHPVSVFGAVKKPGVYQIRGAKTVVEVLSMAQGLAPDAGDTVLVIHEHSSEGPANAGGSSPPMPQEGSRASSIAPTKPASAPSPDPATSTAQKTETIDLKDLLDSGDPRLNAPVYPGDTVKVSRAGIIYVVGEVQKPGGFELKTNENISVLQALALAEGLTRTSAAARAQIIRTDEATGRRKQIPVNLARILSGKSPDPLMKPRDILFVPNSTGRSAVYRGLEAAISVGTGIAIYRR